MAVLVLLLLAQQLRQKDWALRWFAAGLGASMLGGGLQAASVVGADLPAILSVAFPVGNLVESLCWLVAVTLRFREQHLANEQELRRIAYEDPVTGLQNRRRLRERVEAALVRLQREPAAQQQLLLLDLDGFERVNERCGHAGGDTVLRTLGERLTEVLERGELLGRFGGDEFLLLLRPRRDATDARRPAPAASSPSWPSRWRCSGHASSLCAQASAWSRIHAGYVSGRTPSSAMPELALETAQRRGGQPCGALRPVDARCKQQARERLRRELARGAAGRALPAALSTGAGARHRAPAGLRGAAALAPPDTRPAAGGAVHHRRRRHRGSSASWATASSASPAGSCATGSRTTTGTRAST
jgi:GGDEF domain-containing protein